MIFSNMVDKINQKTIKGNNIFYKVLILIYYLKTIMKMNYVRIFNLRFILITLKLELNFSLQVSTPVVLGNDTFYISVMNFNSEF